MSRGMEPPSDQILTPAEAAAFFRVDQELLRKWRLSGTGPKWFRLSEDEIFYKVSDLVDYRDRNPPKRD